MDRIEEVRGVFFLKKKRLSQIFDNIFFLM